MTDWIEWNGGECPVERWQKAQVKLRRDSSETDDFIMTTNKADTLRWNHVGNYGDIVAYRLIDAPSASTETTIWDRVSEAVPAGSASALTRQPGGTHYRDATIQPVQFIEANKLGFLEGCIVKRAARHDKPTGKGREDIEKIIHEAQLLLELRYGGVA